MRRLFDIWSIVLLLFSAGGATLASRTIYTLEGAVVPLLMLATCGIMLVISRLSIKRGFLFVVLGFLLYFSLLTIKFEEIHYKFLFLLPFYFYISYSYLRHFGFRFFSIFQKTVTVLAAISLFVWIGHIFTPSLVENACSKFTFFAPYNEIIVSHCLIYTVVNEAVESALLRNSGFAWEPGAFAVFLSLGVFSNQLSNKFRLYKNRSIWILTTALLTTQSTTGYSILVILLGFHLWNTLTMKTLLLLLPVIALSTFALFSLPFMGDKIRSLAQEDVASILYTASLDWNQTKTLSAQRFVSLQMDWIDFLQHPLLGYGGHDEAMWLRSIAPNVASISGLGKLLAKFGLIGTAFFLLAAIRSARRMLFEHSLRGAPFILVFLLAIGTSYSLLESPLLMCFWFAPFVALPKNRDTYTQTNINHHARNATLDPQ